MKSLQPLAPASLDHLVAVCLAKDPDQRWQSAADIARELKWIAAHLQEGQVAPGGATRWRERAQWMALTAGLIAALAFASWRLIAPAGPIGGIARLAVNPPPGTVFTMLATATVQTPQFAVAPNGRSLAFVASSQELTSMLWLRSLDDIAARTLQGTEGAQEPFWSPDSQWIGYFDETGAMKKVAISGGTVQSIAPAIPDPRGAPWGADGSIVVGTGAGGLYVTAAAGGEIKPLTQLDRGRGEASHRWPQFLADGRHFVFTVRGGSNERRGLHVGSLDGAARTFVYDTEGDPPFTSWNLAGDWLRLIDALKRSAS